MSYLIITLFIYFAFYIICGYATTDILRLTQGNNTKLWDSNCFCPICNHKIRLINQLPILSYFLCGGRCRNCGSNIPKTELILECLVFLLLSSSVTLLHFSWYAYLSSFFLYEAIKFYILITHGIRETYFFKNLSVSLFNNLILWFFLALLFLLYSIVI